MPFPKTSRSLRHREANPSSLRIECLEQRLPLAGNVTAQLQGSTLLLTGDAQDNLLAVASAARGRIAVIGSSATTINGSDLPYVTSRAITNIVANLNGGNDGIGFGNSAAGFANQFRRVGFPVPFNPTDLQTVMNVVSGGVSTFSLPGSLTVTTAAGNDGVGLIGNVSGSVAVNLGSALPGPANFNGFAIGDDTIELAANTIGGAVRVVGGAQDDAVSLNGTNVGGGLSVALGAGTNGIDVAAYGATIGSFAYNGGAGDDIVFLRNDIRVRNGASVVTGPSGDDVVHMDAPVTVGGSMVINTGNGGGGDAVNVAGDIRGAVSVTTGAGDDRIVMGLGDCRIGLGLSISSGAGDDLIGVVSTPIGLNAAIDAGAGKDAVALSGVDVRYTLKVYLGAGDDAVALGDVRALAAVLYGGLGTNALGLNSASRTGIRSLNSYQFQVTFDL